MGYHCKECKALVNQTDAGLVRTCSHTGTIIVGMSATCYGEGGASIQPKESALARLARAILGPR